MKRFLKMLMLVFIVIFLPANSAYAASNPYPTQQNMDGDAYYEIPCTRFAWQQAYDKLGIALPGWGNAVNWWQNAKNSGYSTGSSPKANSIAVWSGDTYGHVAYVTSGSGNTFTVNEGGRTDLDHTDSHGVAYGYTLTNAVGSSRPYDSGKTLLGFIYLDGTPNRDPIGCFDNCVGGTGTITLTGWAFDPDSPSQSLAVHVYIGGPAGSSNVECYGFSADVDSPDVNKAYGISGKHRFIVTLPVERSGNQPVYVYALNAQGGNNPQFGTKTVNISKDNEKPVVTNAKISDLDSTGYTVTCTVKDNVAIKKVEFPTWSEENDQDDIVWYEGKIQGNTVTVRVNASKHGVGRVHTHIYAYDYAGNSGFAGVSCIIPCSSHIWNSGKIVEQASCKKEGKKEFICSKCGTKKIESIDKINHTIVVDKGVLATCTKTGLTEGSHCSVCGEIIKKQTIIPAKGHTVVIDKAVPATKTSTGLTEGSHCSVCKAIIKRQQIIPALGDKADNGIGTISSDGKTLTDTDNVKYYISEKLKNKDLKKNLKIADKMSGGKYKITKVIKKKGKVVGGNVTYMAPYNKNCTKATAGATVKLGGVNFKITALNANAFKNCKKLKTFKAGGNMLTIGKNAFNGCSSLKLVTITSTKLKSIGSNAFKGTTSKTKYKVPKSRLLKYSVMILKAGASTDSKITK